MKDNISDIATSWAAFTRFRGLYHNEGYVGYMVFRVTSIRQPYYLPFTHIRGLET